MKFIVLAFAIISAVSGYAIDKDAASQSAVLQAASSHGASQPAVVIGVPANAGHLSGVGLAYGGAPSILVPARPAAHYAPAIPIQSIAAAQGAAVSQAYSAGYQQGLANSHASLPAYGHNWHGSALPGHSGQALAIQSSYGSGKY